MTKYMERMIKCGMSAEEALDTIKGFLSCLSLSELVYFIEFLEVRP